MRSRVFITGIGVVAPIGTSREAFWDGCLNGRSGARPLITPWVEQTGLSTRFASFVEDYGSAAAGLTPRHERLIDRTTLFALGATHEALLDAGFVLEPNPEKKGQLVVHGPDPTRLATVVGSGVGGLASMERSHAIWRERRTKAAVKRYSLPMLIPNAPAGQIALRFGARGECKSVSTACASGTMSIGDSFHLLNRGEADVVLAGGAEGVALDDDAYALMGFERLQVLSTRNDEPERASRPFDRERDGFVLGEGAAVLVLEREEQATARGARPYATIAGYASNCDAHSMMQMEPSGETIVRLIGDALRSADLDSQAIDFVSAHGTSTRPNDRLEARVLREVFGKRCDDLPVTALKSMTGHAIAASGAMEVAAACLSMRRRMLTPTINYEYPDPECDVDVVANRPRERAVSACLKLSYGFGGHNAALVLTDV